MAPGRSHWRDAPDRALFPFGSGQGYTRFALADLQVPAKVAKDEAVQLRVAVTNAGLRRGEAFVRADIHDRVASRTRPARQMKAHARVTLDPGERKVVTLAIPHAELALVAADGQWRVEPGAFDLWVDAGGVELHSQFDAV